MTDLSHDTPRRGPGRPSRTEMDAARQERDHQPLRQRRSQGGGLGAPTAKLTASQRPGYVRRWVNDKPGRVDLAHQHDWDFVLSDPNAKPDDVGSRISKIVGTHEDGTPMRSYLMEIPEDWYREDQARKEAENSKVDNAIRSARRGQSVTAPEGATGADAGAFYTPAEGSSIRHDLRR